MQMVSSPEIFQPNCVCISRSAMPWPSQTSGCNTTLKPMTTIKLFEWKQDCTTRAGLPSSTPPKPNTRRDPKPADILTRLPSHLLGPLSYPTLFRFSPQKFCFYFLFLPPSYISNHTFHCICYKRASLYSCFSKCRDHKGLTHVDKLP